MIGYAVNVRPELASYRLRVFIPSQHLGMPYAIGSPGDVTFMYKMGNPSYARECGPVVFDVVNDHFDRAPQTLEMCELAARVTVGSESMAAVVKERTGRTATVIDDPYENAERPAACGGDRVLWFGHAVNLPSLNRLSDRVRGLKLQIVTNAKAPGLIPWSRFAEDEMLHRCAVVLLTGTNPGASSNRVVKAIRAGRFCVMPEDCAPAWREFAPFAWAGDVREGVEWALANREEAVQKVKAGQEWIRAKYSPQVIGKKWAALFGSILAPATSENRAG